MARIFYGVQGDAGGHISRSLAVAEMLSGHEFLFAGAGAAARARDAGHAFEPLPWAGTHVRDNAIQVGATLRDFGIALATQGKWVRRLGEIITAFDPHLILTDYEFFTSRAARRLGRPCLSLDHQHVMTRTVHPTPPGQWFNRRATRVAMRLLLPGVDGSLISSFHQPPLIDPERDRIFGTLPRSDVPALRPRDGEHVLAYLPDCDTRKVTALFGSRRREYRIYAQGRRREQGNLKFREPGRERFLEDLASAAYVVSCGGHGLLTEAFYLGKPCLCFPRRGIYEPLWNSYFVQQSGYGRYYTSFDIPAGAIDDFEASLDAYKARIVARNFDGRAELKVHLEDLLQKAGGGPATLETGPARTGSAAENGDSSHTTS